jgi:hypothetical protein
MTSLPDHRQPLAKPTDDIELAWSAMVLLPNGEWANIKCYEGQIKSHTLH